MIFRMITLADRLLIGILVVASLAGIIYPAFVFRAEGGVAQVIISVDGKVVRSVKLDGHHEVIRVEGTDGYDVVEIFDNKVRIVEADCPDKLCLKQGWIAWSPQQLVCLPNRVVVKIINSLKPDVDAVI